MFTPQEVSEKTFPKSTGLTSGYNMTAVDEFLDGLTEDYTALYKDNTTLKAKLKMLAEKVEEYRATEDAMRSTLLAAQKMAAQMVADAQAEKEKTIADAQAQAEQILADARGEADIQARQLQQEIRDSWEKLAAAQRKTGMNEAAVTALGTIGGQKCVVGVLDSRFMMGSMSAAVGEKITLATEYAAKNQLPLILFAASGGARMQEGILSLMQIGRASCRERV